MRFFRFLALVVLGTLLSVNCGDSSKITSVTVSASATSAPAGRTIQLTATATYSNHKTVTITGATWSSSDTTTASVDATGLVKGIKAGTVTITGTYKNVNGTISLTINPAVLDSFTPSAANVSLALGLTQTLTLSGTMSDGSSAGNSSFTSCTWTSSNTGVATLTAASGASSTVNTAGQGSATITVVCGTIQQQITVTISAPVVTALAISPTNPSIAVGATQQFAAKATMTDGSTQDMTTSATWTSSNTTYVTIDTTTMGLAHGVAAGSSTITASVTSGGHAFTNSTLLTVTQQVTGSAPNGLLYVWTQGIGNIYVYGIQPDNTLLAMPTSMVKDGDDNPNGAVLDPSGTRIYSIASTSPVVVYGSSINFNTGALTAITGSPFTVDTSAQAQGEKLLFNASKHWLYVDDFRGYIEVGYLKPYAWDSSSGSISTPELSSYAYDGEYDVLQDWKFVPDGSVLYTVNDYISTDYYLERMVVNPTTGALTGGGETTGTAYQSPPLVIHPTGKFLYLGTSDGYTIEVLDITGTTPLLVSTYTIDTTLRATIFDSVHNILYVVEQQTNTTPPEIVSYSADYSTGQLTKLSSVTLDGTVNLALSKLALSPDGNMLYAGGYAPSTGDSAVLALSANPQTHALTQVQNIQLPVTGVLVYPIVAAPPAGLTYNAGVVNSLEGAAEAFQAFVRFPAFSSDPTQPTTNPLIDDVITRVKVYVGDFSPTSTMTLLIYRGTSDSGCSISGHLGCDIRSSAHQMQPVTLTYTQTIDPLTITPNSWNTITLTTPVLIANDDYWVGFSVDASVELGIDGTQTTPLDGAHMYNAVNGWTYIGGLWDIEVSVIPQINLI